MSDYTAPLQDMKFVIEELVGLDRISALPGCEEVNGELVDAVLGEAAKFASGVLAPLNRPGDQQGARFADGAVASADGFREAYRQFIEAGWNGLSGQQQFGGQGLPEIVSVPVSEIWNSANMAFCLCPMLTSGAVEAITRHGSPELQQRYLPKLTSGEWTGTMDLTESQAGSDLSAVRTRAVPEGDRYRLYGTKIFITWGEHDLAENIIHLVLARTPNAPEGTKGISLFVVPKILVNENGSLDVHNDVHCVSIEHKLGIHASPTAVIAYGDKDGAIGYLVGEENRGLEYMFTMMNLARLGVGTEGVAIAERAYQHALAYAKQRVQGREIGVKNGGRVTIIHHPDVRRMLMSMKAQIEAMRALAYFTAGALDIALRHPDPQQRAESQALFDLLTPVVKGWCTEQSIEIASLGVQIHGGMGYVEETGAAQYLRDARITSIYEGTTGIQALDLLGRKIAFDKGVAVRALFMEMQKLAAQNVNTNNANVVAILASFRPALASLIEATESLLRAFSGELKGAVAGAVPYLKMFGFVAGGWQMTQAALVADRKLVEGVGNRDFYNAKITTTRFYADHILPMAYAHGHAVEHGAASVMGLAEDQF